MFDDFNFFSPIGTEGSRKMRIFTGLLGAVVGGVLGYFLSTVTASDTAPSLLYGFAGAALGGFFGALFSFAIVVGLLMVAAVVCVLSYQWFFGG